MNITPSSRPATPPAPEQASPSGAQRPDPAPAQPAGSSEALLVTDGLRRRRQIEGELPAAPQRPAPLAAPPRPYRAVVAIENAGTGLACLGYLALGHAALIARIGIQPSSLIPNMPRLVPGMLAAGVLMLLSAALFCRRFPPPIMPHPERIQLDAWHRALRLPIEPRAWHGDQPDALDTLMAWLDSVPRDHGFDDSGTRHALLARVREILVGIDTSDNARESVLRVAEQSQFTGGTIWQQLGLAQLMLQDSAAREGRLTTRHVFELGRGLARLAHLEHIVRHNEAALLQNVDGLSSIDEVIRVVQISLQHTLGLPMNAATDGPVPDVGWAFERIARTVMREEHRPSPAHALALFDTQCRRLTCDPPLPLSTIRKNPLALFLATGYEAWAHHVDENAREEVAEFKSLVMDYQNRLDNTPLEDRSFNEQAYLVTTREAMFLHNHGMAYRRALLEMLDDERPHVG